jgi:hypothetical protein
MDSGINKIIPKLIEETPYQGAKSFSVKVLWNYSKRVKL